MATISTLEAQGQNVLVRYTDGTTQFFYPAGSRFIPGPYDATGVETGAGDTGVDDSGGGGGTPGSVASPTDDYPWPNAPQDALSPLRYSYRDCTDFVAWRINRDAGVTSAPWKWTWGNLRWQGAGGNGDAIGWRGDWIKYGRDVDITPVAGCIGWYNTGTYGHVNYVQSVQANGTIHVEEYNWSPNRQAYGQRTISPGDTYYPTKFLSMPH